MRKYISFLLALTLSLSLLLSGCAAAQMEDRAKVEDQPGEDMETLETAEENMQSADGAQVNLMSANSTEDQTLVGDPLIGKLGFDLRNVYVVKEADADGYVVTILDAKKTDTSGNVWKYGIAAYDRATGKASNIERYQWMTPDSAGRITFQGVSEPSFILTSAKSADAEKHTPAEYYNMTTDPNARGWPYVLPTENIYNLMETVKDSDVIRFGSEIVIYHTKDTREYALFDNRGGKLITEWKKGTGGEVHFLLKSTSANTVVAVTRITESALPYIVPYIPPVIPGADPARTRAGFSERTGNAVLTLEATPGMTYAIAAEDGHILSHDERMQWGITAESEYGINVMADDTNFYATPADGSKILFRVPPGGRYFVVTRLPNGTTSMPTTPYQTTTVVNNIRFVAHWDKARRSWITVVTIYPASSYSEYALRAKATHITTLYKRAVNDKVEIESYILYAKDLDILARPIPLQPSQGDNTGTPSPGREGTLPPVLDMPVSGTGQTASNGGITAEPWSPLGNGETATAAALASEAGKNLDPNVISGAVPVIVRVKDVEDPVTLIVFYDWNSKPTAALYYYGDNWYTAKVQSAQGGKFTVSFEQGFKGSISLDALIEKAT